VDDPPHQETTHRSHVGRYSGVLMLDGIRVIEMATYIAAPGAGGIMADWGADVIKVEPL